MTFFKSMALVFAVLLLGAFSSGCLEFDVDAQPYLCFQPGAADCGEGFVCLRGEKCYCYCQPLGSTVNPSCADALCDNVKTL